jgi:hypothetical protein
VAGIATSRIIFLFCTTMPQCEDTILNNIFGTSNPRSSSYQAHHSKDSYILVLQQVLQINHG